MSTTPAQVTKAHRIITLEIRRTAHDGAFALRATECDALIADSEARAVEPWRTQVEELRGALALGQQNCDDVFYDLREERDQLRAEVERLKYYQIITQRSIKQAVARAERAEAEHSAVVKDKETLTCALEYARADLAKERART